MKSIKIKISERQYKRCLEFAEARCKDSDLYKNSKKQQQSSASFQYNTNEPAYELSVLQLNAADRQRLYEVIQTTSAFPAKRESLVKGLSVDLQNKARRLLQNSS